MNEYKNLRVGCGKFLYGSKAIHQLPLEMHRLGGRPFIISGPTTGKILKKALDENELVRHGIKLHHVIHTQQCSCRWAKEYSSQAIGSNSTVIVGVGGGKCIDLAKCISEYAGLPIITVPTSIATCVATSSICIMYKDDGKPDQAVNMSHEVDVAIADTDIIGTAPKRLLAAGIFDSLAKYPEVIHNRNINTITPDSKPLEKYISTVNSKALWDVLMHNAKDVYSHGVCSEQFTDFVLSILLHTSVVSGFSSGSNQLALAHGIYEFVKENYTEQSSQFLHGEIVAAGIPVQMRFNGVSHLEFREIMDLLNFMSLPCSLTDLGCVKTEKTAEMLSEFLIRKTGLSNQDHGRILKALEGFI